MSQFKTSREIINDLTSQIHRLEHEAATTTNNYNREIIHMQINCINKMIISIYNN